MDIKPENCLLHGDTLKISDFGLAKSFDDLAVAPDLPFVLRASDTEHPTSTADEPGTADHLPRLCSMSMIITRTGVAAGTPRYMAPEQFDDIKRVDVKADIYSFGVVLFQMLTGRLPFTGGSLSEYQRLHQRVPPPRVSTEEPACRTWWGTDRAEREGMLRNMSEIVHRCLAKDPTQRFEDFQAVRQALVRAAPSGVASPLPRPFVARQLTEDELLVQGLSYIQMGRQNLALAALDQLLERYPRNNRARVEKGKLLMSIPHRYEEGWAILKQAETTGDLPYTLVDVETHLPKILDNILDQLFKVFEQAVGAFVIFREGMSRRLVVKASRTRWPQNEDSFLSRISASSSTSAIT